MEEHVLGITRLVNHLLGPLVLSLLHALHIAPENPGLPIPQHVVMGLVVLAIGTLVAFSLRSRLSVEKPGAAQQVAEMLLTNPLGIGIRDLLEENAGNHASRYIGFVGAILFLLVDKYEPEGPLARLLKFLILFVAGVAILHKLQPYGLALF